MSSPAKKPAATLMKTSRKGFENDCGKTSAKKAQMTKPPSKEKEISERSESEEKVTIKASKGDAPLQKLQAKENGIL